MKKSVLQLVSGKKYFVFDFDGVVLESVRIKTDAFAALYAEFGSDVVAKVVAHHELNGGVSRFEKFKHYHLEFLGLRLSVDELEHLNNVFSKLVLKKILAANVVNGVFTFIDEIIGKGKVCGINSATPEDELRLIVEQRNFTKYFESVLGSPCTKLENLHKIKAQFNCEYSDMIFFGDATSDFDAALMAGIEFVGLGIEGGVLGTGKYDCCLIPDFDNIHLNN